LRYVVYVEYMVPMNYFLTFFSLVFT